MSEFSGIKTIGFVDKNYFPSRIEISMDLVLFGQIALTKWNVCGLSLIPYCTTCREVVNWLWPPEGDVLFRCPTCKREWIKDSDWLITEEKKTKIGRKR